MYGNIHNIIEYIIRLFNIQTDHAAPLVWIPCVDNNLVKVLTQEHMLHENEALQLHQRSSNRCIQSVPAFSKSGLD